MWEVFLQLCLQPLGVLERQYNISKNTNSGGTCLLAKSPSPLHGSVTWDELLFGPQLPLLYNGSRTETPHRM